MPAGDFRLVPVEVETGGEIPPGESFSDVERLKFLLPIDIDLYEVSKEGTVRTSEDEDTDR